MEELNIDIKNMTFLEALLFSYLTGKSYTVTRYSASAKNSVQYYVRNGSIYCQDKENKAEKLRTITPQRMIDSFEIYEGDYEQYHNIIQADIEKFNRLKIELEPLYSHFKEYERLKQKIEDSEDY